MKTLRSHIVVLSKKYPPSTFFEYLIDKKTGAEHGHWYWEGDFHDDGFERTPLFVQRAPPPDRRTGKYIVARLLWVEANPGTYSRLTLANVCGVFACVNPAHWENPLRARTWTLPPDAGAVPVRCVHPGGPSVHIRSEEGKAFAVCGRTFHHNTTDVTVMPLDTELTCTRCIATWREMGRPLNGAEVA